MVTSVMMNLPKPRFQLVSSLLTNIFIKTWGGASDESVTSSLAWTVVFLLQITSSLLTNIFRYVCGGAPVELVTSADGIAISLFQVTSSLLTNTFEKTCGGVPTELVTSADGIVMPFSQITSASVTLMLSLVSASTRGAYNSSAVRSIIALM